MAQYDRKYFEKQFEGLPPKAMAIIALRAAMRVFPVLAQRRDATGAAFWFWPAGDRVRHTLGVCRCLQYSAFVHSLTKDVPALLAPEQPDHDFKPDGAIAFRFDFGGFLPRHVLPALAVEYFQDIAKVSGREIVWQNGVLLHPRRQDSQALVRADYHTRTIDILVKGTDATLYLGMLRDSILATLETMPQLPFEEKVELRPDMRTTAVGPGRPDGSVWISYEIIQTAQRSDLPSIPGPGGIYAMDRVLAAMPVRPDLRQAKVFLSYSSKDGAQVQSLADELEGKHISVWYDRGLIAGQPYRDVLRQRIETVKAVVVLWTENSISSKWVKAEADLADRQKKLICLRDPKLEPTHIPMPFAANNHIVEFGKMPELLEALALMDAKPRI